MRVVYNVQNAPGNRVEYAEVLCANCSVPKYEPLDESRNYVAVVPAFLMDGGDFFDMLRIQAKYCKKIGKDSRKSNEIAGNFERVTK